MIKRFLYKLKIQYILYNNIRSKIYYNINTIIFVFYFLLVYQIISHIILKNYTNLFI